MWSKARKRCAHEYATPVAASARRAKLSSTCAALCVPGIEDLREKREGMLKQIADEEAEKVKVRCSSGHLTRGCSSAAGHQPFGSTTRRRGGLQCATAPACLLQQP